LGAVEAHSPRDTCKEQAARIVVLVYSGACLEMFVERNRCWWAARGTNVTWLVLGGGLHVKINDVKMHV
jgi:hypothetical protein